MKTSLDFEQFALTCKTSQWTFEGATTAGSSRAHTRGVMTLLNSPAANP